MPFIEQLGMQAASDAVGGIMGLALGGINDRRQVKQQGRLQKQQIAGNKEMMDYQMMKQLQMWKDTNYNAQKEQLKLAGLNPGLLYGMSGGGGTTTGNASASVQGAQAPSGGREIQDMIGMGIQGGLQEAQRKLIEAQTENVKADTTKKAGVDTTEAQSRIGALVQETKNKQLQGTLLQYEQRLKDMEVAEKGATINDRIEMVTWALRQAVAGVEKSEGEAFIMSNTKTAVVETVQQEAIGAAIKNVLMEAQIKATDAQIQKWKTEIAQGWQGLDRQERELKLKTFEAQIRAEFPGLSNALGQILSGAIDGIMDLTVPEGKRNSYKAPDTQQKR